MSAKIIPSKSLDVVIWSQWFQCVLVCLFLAFFVKIGYPASGVEISSSEVALIGSILSVVSICWICFVNKLLYSRRISGWWLSLVNNLGGTWQAVGMLREIGSLYHPFAHPWNWVAVIQVVGYIANFLSGAVPVYALLFLVRFSPPRSSETNLNYNATISTVSK